MRSVAIFLIACGFAAGAPLVDSRPGKLVDAPPFPGWPGTWEEAALSPLPLTAQELTWAKDFPGKAARFRVEGVPGDLLIRWTHAPTRDLHPSRHCYRAAGFAVEAMSAFKDRKGREWSRFRARNDQGTQFEVRELVDGGDFSFPDVNAWYWAAGSGGSWWAYTWSMPLAESP